LVKFWRLPKILAATKNFGHHNFQLHTPHPMLSLHPKFCNFMHTPSNDNIAKLCEPTLMLHWCFSVFFVAHTIILHSLFHSPPGNPFPYRDVPVSFASVPCFHLGRSVTTMGCSKCGGRGKKPPSSPSVTFVNGIPIESNVVPSPSVTLVIDGFPIRAMPHLAADAEVGSPDAPPDPEGHEDSQVPIREMPHLAADAEVGSPNAPPDPKRHKD
jgi:hypothetical protein